KPYGRPLPYPIKSSQNILQQDATVPISHSSVQIHQEKLLQPTLEKSAIVESEHATTASQKPFVRYSVHRQAAPNAHRPKKYKPVPMTLDLGKVQRPITGINRQGNSHP